MHHTEKTPSHSEREAGAPGLLARYGRVLILVLQGVLIGIGGILPGVSGGVLCVIFGLYQPVIAVLSNPIANLRHHWRLVLPAGLGVLLGFLGCAGLVSSFMEKNSQAAVCVFIGLILGMFPSLWKDAGREGRPRSAWVGLAVSFLAFVGLLAFLRRGTALDIEPNFGWFVFCGVAWGLSIVVPGLSSSSMLIFFGLYQPMLAGMAHLDLGVLVPLAIGACAVVFTLSRVVGHLFERWYALASHCILGLVAATTVMILPTRFQGAGEVLLDLLCMAGGLVAAYGIGRLTARVAASRAIAGAEPAAEGAPKEEKGGAAGDDDDARE